MADKAGSVFHGQLTPHSGCSHGYYGVAVSTVTGGMFDCLI